MQILVTKPDVAKFIAEQVSTGRFSSPEAVVEAGLARLMEEPAEGALDDQTLDAIEAADAQIDRGEGIDFREFAAATRKKYALR